MKLHLGKRVLRQIEGKDAWWSENRPAAPDLFARELRDTLEFRVTTALEAVELGSKLGAVIAGLARDRAGLPYNCTGVPIVLSKFQTLESLIAIIWLGLWI